MTLEVKHNAVSSRPATSDPNDIDGPNWNENHNITMTAGTLLGAHTGGDGSGAEVTLGDNLAMDTNGVLSASLGSGAISASGTPVDNQVGVWTSATGLEGDANFTWDGSTLTVAGALAGVTSIDATTDATISAAVTITESQISDLQTYLTAITGESIGSLSDVSISSPTTLQYLAYNGSNWANRSPLFSDIGSTVSDAQVPESAVTQHEAALNIVPANMASGSGAGATTFFRGDGVWATLGATTGFVSYTGTPVNNELAHWSADGEITNDSNLTWDGTSLSITGNISVTGNVDGRDVSTDGAKLDTTVVGPGTSVDNRIARFDGVTGYLVQSSGVEIDDSGNYQANANITLTGTTNTLSTPIINMGTTVDADKLLLYQNGNTKYGLGIQGGEVRLFTPTGAANYIRWGDVSPSDGSTFTEWARVSADGFSVGTGAQATEAFDISGNIAITGTVDGRDVSADGTTLDALDAANSADVTLAGEDYLSIAGQVVTANAIDLDNLSATGTASSSTFLRGDNTWATATAVSAMDDLTDVNLTTVAQGDILYRNATEWVNLPPGTSGQFLKTQGAAANPTWDTIAGGGDLLAANNLSDVANAATAATNLGLGTGNTPTFTGIQVNNADTTLDRASAGDIRVEGNIVYRAGGTDVPVTDGGTGSSTASGARTNLGVAIGSDVMAHAASASQVEMETGTEAALRAMSPLRVAQAIAALAGGGGGVNEITTSVFTATGAGTWTKPTGFVFGIIIATGAGGGGIQDGSGDSGSGGGAGGTAFKFVNDADVASTEAVSVGTGGDRDSGATVGVDGGDTTFDLVVGSITATGGEGGNFSTSGAVVEGGIGGVPTGGDLNIPGGGGGFGSAGATDHRHSYGGSSFWGSCGSTSDNVKTDGAYGSGGFGASDGLNRYKAGQNGVIMVIEFNSV